MSNSSYKNVVSIQTSIGATGAVASGLTLAAASGSAAATITKHKGFVITPIAGTALVVIPTYYGSDGNALTGVTLSTPLGNSQPHEIPLRMRSFTGLTGGTIMFVV